MFCKKCGKEIADTVKFCAFCGAPVGDDQVSMMPVRPITSDEEDKTVAVGGSDDDATVVVPKHVNKKDQEGGQGEHVAKAMVPPPVPDVSGFKATDQSGGAYTQPGNDLYTQKAQPEETRKSHTGIVLAILGIVAVALIAVVIFLVRGLFGGKNTMADDLYYVKDGDLSAVLKIAAKEPADVEIDSIRGWDNEYSSSVMLSDDGKYLYYFDKIDEDSESGTLCCIPTDKLRKKGDNEQYIEEIESKVDLESMTLIDSTTVIYMRKGEKLIIYKDGENYELSDDVREYSVTDDKRYVLYTEREDSDSGNTLFCAEIKKDPQSREIDSHIDRMYDSANSSYILYGKNYDDENNTIDVYAAGADKDPVLVAEDVYGTYGICADDKSFYYTVSNSNEVPLYSYVIDSYTESDANVQEPQVTDYMEKVNEEDVLSDDDKREYAGQPFSHFLEGEVFIDGTDEFGLYGHRNSTDGNYYYYDRDNKQWYGNFDWETYNSTYADYQKVGERNSLREQLKQETCKKYYQELYFCRNGESKLICENVGNVYTEAARGVIYQKTDLESGSAEYAIDEVYSVDDLREDIEDDRYENEDHTMYCCVNGGSETEISDFDSIDSIRVSQDGKTVVISGNYDEENGEELIAYQSSEKGLGEGKKLTDEGAFAGFRDNVFYFYDQIDDEEADFYSYQGNTSKLLAKDIYRYQAPFIADDGAIIGFTDWDDKDYTGELTCFGKDGKGERIAKDINLYRYLGSGAYLYRQDGDLYYQDKKGNENRLAKGVDYFWYPREVNGFYAYFD